MTRVGALALTLAAVNAASNSTKGVVTKQLQRWDEFEEIYTCREDKTRGDRYCWGENPGDSTVYWDAWSWNENYSTVYTYLGKPYRCGFENNAEVCWGYEDGYYWKCGYGS